MRKIRRIRERVQGFTSGLTGQNRSKHTVHPRTAGRKAEEGDEGGCFHPRYSLRFHPAQCYRPKPHVRHSPRPLPASRKPHPLPASRKPCPLPACYASTHWFLALTNVLLIFWCYRCRRTFVYVQRRSLRFAHFVRFASFALVLLHRSRCSLFRTVRFAHSDRSLCSLCSTSSASASFPASSSLVALALRSLPESSRRSISATLRYAYAARLAVCAFIWNSLVRFSKSRGKIPTNK